MVELGGSDLLLKAGTPPVVRMRGELQLLSEDHDPLGPWQTEQLLYSMITTGRIKEFETHGEIDFAYSVPGLARFRVSGYKQRGSVSIVMRVVPKAVGSIESLGLPDVIRRLADEDRGLVLVTGGTGSGKSTTLAAMVSHINETAPKHIVTIEDPIEYLHRDVRSVIDQREVGTDTESFGNALRRVLRQDPDVILIGEMRDEETVRAALAAAETGHLVLSTLHTLDAGETMNRIIDFFQPHEQQHARAMLAGTLKGIISQRLAPTFDGEGRMAVCEILTMTGRVHDTILDAEADADLRDIITEGEHYGMQTFDQALYQALTAGKIDMQTALRISSRPHDFKLLVDAGGHMSTSMEHLTDADADCATLGSTSSSPPEEPADRASANGSTSMEDLAGWLDRKETEDAPEPNGTPFEPGEPASEPEGSVATLADNLRVPAPDGLQSVPPPLSAG
jgi:twitching motility protein PilT